MKLISFVVFNIVETLLRFFPFPSKTGLLKIGNPGPDSPVFLTCNYHLTVQRVKRALRGIDAYLLLANSRGVNVWCAASGGHLTNHDVISALKTSGTEELVNQRKVILPQLAGTGVEAQVIQKKTGWKVIWGPVYAKDIPFFLKNRLKKTPKMREVRFPWTQRLEMAAAWAFPISLLGGLIAILVSPGILIPLVCLVWGLSLSIFITFPLYSSWLNSERKRLGFSLISSGIVLLALVAFSLISANFSWRFLFRWGLLSFIVIFILSIDLKGSTPLLKSGFLQDRRLKVILDEGKCKGAGFCEQICPKNCFEVDEIQHRAKMPGAERCIRCSACIVQCPFDALLFESPKGERIGPEIIRKFKLNLFRKRL